MKVALCVFDEPGTQDHYADLTKAKFCTKFPDISVDLFYSFSANSWQENLFQVKWVKRCQEILNKTQYNVNVGVMATKYQRLEPIKTLDVDPLTLYFVDGHNSNFKTGIEPTCFYGNSLVFDRTAEYSRWVYNPNIGIDGSKKFYWYIKTWKIATKCVDMQNFKIL